MKILRLAVRVGQRRTFWRVLINLWKGGFTPCADQVDENKKTLLTWACHAYEARAETLLGAPQSTLPAKEGP